MKEARRQPPHETLAKRDAVSLYEEGKEKLNQKRYPEAISCLVAAAESAKALSSAAVLERSLFELGRAYFELGQAALDEGQKPTAIDHFKKAVSTFEDCQRLGGVYPLQSAVLLNQAHRALRALGAQKPEGSQAGSPAASRAITALQTIPFHGWENGEERAASRNASAALFALVADYDSKEAQLMGLRCAADGFEKAAEKAAGKAERATLLAGEATALALLGIFNEERRPEYFSSAYEKFQLAVRAGLLSAGELKKTAKAGGLFKKPSADELEKAAIASVALGDFAAAETALSRASKLWYEMGMIALREGLASYLTFTQAVDSANACFIRCQRGEIRAASALYYSMLSEPPAPGLANSPTVKMDMAIGLLRLNSWLGLEDAFGHLRGNAFNHGEVIRRLERAGAVSAAYPLLTEYLAEQQYVAQLAYEALVRGAPASVPFLIFAASTENAATQRARSALREILKKRTCLAEQVSDIKAVLGE